MVRVGDTERVSRTEVEESKKVRGMFGKARDKERDRNGELMKRGEVKKARTVQRRIKHLRAAKKSKKHKSKCFI